MSNKNEQFDENFEGYEDYESYTVQDALDALPIDEEGIVPAPVVLGFSDIALSDRDAIRPVWQKLSAAQRQIIMERLAETSEADYAVDYSVFATLGYDDPDPGVRLASIQAGWADASFPTMHKLMDIAQHDLAADVRAAGIQRLGMYIYMGEVEELDHNQTRAAEDLAIALARDTSQPLEVQRRALESAAHASRPGIGDMITAAYNHKEPLMRASAVSAMGNTADEVWADHVLRELDSKEAEMRFEAVRSAGALGLRKAVKPLAKLAMDEDREIQEAAVWSLGEIGGDEAMGILDKLSDYAYDNEDDDLLEAIEDALGMAAIMSDLDADFEMMVFEDDDDEDYEDEALEDEDFEEYDEDEEEDQL